MRRLHAFLQRLLVNLALISLIFYSPVLANTNPDVDQDFLACQNDPNPQDCYKRVAQQKEGVPLSTADHDLGDVDRDFLVCQSDPDSQSCYERVARDKTDASTPSSASEITPSMVALMHSIFLVVAGAAGLSGGGCASKWTFIGASALWFVSDFALKKDVEDKLEKNRKEYRKEAKNKEKTNAGKASFEDDSSFQAQIRAFKYLKDEQVIIKESAQNRADMQKFATIGYKAALALAIMELTLPFMPKCKIRSEINLSLSIPVPGIPIPNFASTALPVKKIDIGTSAGIAISSGFMIFLSEKLKEEAETQRDKADDNIKNKIDPVMESYENKFKNKAGVCPTGRDDPENLKCYCFDENGNEITDREKFFERLKICKEVWKQEPQNSDPSTNVNVALDKKDDDPSSKKDNPSSKKEPSKGCLNKDYQFDYECSCLKKDAKTGKDSCHQIPEDDFSPEEDLAFNKLIGDPSAAQEISKTRKLLNSFTKGTNHAIGKISNKEISASAQRFGKINKNLLKKLRKKDEKIAKKIDDAKKYAKKILDPSSWKSNKTSAAKLPKEALSGRPPASTASARLNKASLKTGNEAVGAKDAQISPSSNTTKKGTDLDGANTSSGRYQYYDDADDFEEEDDGTQGTFPNTEDASADHAAAAWFDFKKGPTVRKRELSIWKIITERYFKTGYKLLLRKRRE